MLVRFLPFIQLGLNAETYVARHVSVDLLGGGGVLVVPHSAIRFWYAGAGLRAYPTGSVQRGFYAGLKGAYLRTTESGSDADGTHEDIEDWVAAGLSLGYKWVTRGGFVIDLALGPHLVAREDRDPIVLPMGDFGLGFAF